MHKSNHLITRAAQRSLKKSDVQFVLEYGERHRNAGCIFYQLTRKPLPDFVAPNDRRRKLVGTTVLVCKCDSFAITTYRNRNAFHADKKKDKYDTSNSHCPFCNGRTYLA